MGYAEYVLPDGTRAGYAVATVCDAQQCEQVINRGLDYLCGQWPLGVEPDAPGCRRYFCPAHQAPDAHQCTSPPPDPWADEDDDEDAGAGQ